MEILQPISLILSVLSFLLPLIVGYKNRRTLLWMYVFAGLAFDIALLFIKMVLHLNVYPLANLYVLVEFIMLSVYYYRATKNEFKYFLHVAMLLVVLYIIQTFAIGIANRNGTGAAGFYFVYLIYALFGFYVISKKHEHTVLANSSFFWVNVAVLLGSSGRVIFFLFEDYLIANHNSHLGELWIVYRMFNILINVLLAIALSKKYE